MALSRRHFIGGLFGVSVGVGFMGDLAATAGGMESQLCELVFHNKDIRGFGDATGLKGSSCPGAFYISLHTADPSDGTQATSEVDYRGYRRVAVPRSPEFWDMSEDEERVLVWNAKPVVFQRYFGMRPAVTHFGVGTSRRKAGHVLFSGAIPKGFRNPRFAAGMLQIVLA